MEMERSHKTIYLNDQELLALVRKAFPDCQRLDCWRLLSGGALNTTYQFQIGIKSFVLRLYVRDHSHCKTEKMIHDLIKDRVPISKLVYADDTHKPLAYSIFGFIEGSHISEVFNKHKTTLSFELGRTLAAIHAFKFPEAGLFGDGMTIGRSFKIGSSPYFEETFSVLSKSQNVRSRLGETLADKTIAFIQKNNAYFPIVTKDNICLTHSDFKPVNLLYNEGQVFVLDWEFAHAGIGILDFAILLRHRDQFPCDIDALEKGYTDFGGKLPDGWFRSALITDFVNVVMLLDSPPQRPQLFRQLKATIQSTMTNWNSL